MERSHVRLLRIISIMATTGLKFRHWPHPLAMETRGPARGKVSKRSANQIFVLPLER